MNSVVFAQFTTPTINGVINAGEYGSHLDGANQQTTIGTTWFMTWDNTNLYVAFSGSNFNEAGVLYLDMNPVFPVNGGTGADGSNQGFYNWDEDHAILPFRVDFVLYFKNGYNQYRYSDGAGYYGGPNENLLTSATNGGTNTIEIAIPWNTITQGNGRPASFNWMGYRVYVNNPSDHGVYGQIPTGNPFCTPCGNPVSKTYHTYYYNVLNTANGASTLPFSVQSFTYMEDNSAPTTGGYVLNGGVLYDVTVNDTSSIDNTDNDTGNWGNDNAEISNRLLLDGATIIEHDLYIGMGSAVLPKDNNPATVNASLQFTGGDGTIYNEGRMDANPEPGNFASADDRRLDLIFSGSTTIAASTVFKDHYRWGNIAIQSGARLQAPATGTAEIELQFGVLANTGGTLDLGDGSAGYVDLGTRGDLGWRYDYYLLSSDPGSIFIVHDFLIGRDSSTVRPAPALPVNLQVKGDFENYSEFMAVDGVGEIKVTMNGIGRQEFRGHINETNNATTTFHDLEIANDNGAGNNNSGADVHFVSFGGGTVAYEATGTFTLTSGDLITRDRGTSLAHKFTLMDGASVDVTGATNDVGAAPSSFVDGPLRAEVTNAGMVTRQFPVGKTYVATGVEIGDYRLLELELDHITATSTVYTTEMFGVDRSLFYTWPAPVLGEVIGSISEQRYWNVTPEAGGSALDSAFITLHYHTGERTDDVTNAPSLRIVKDNGVGDWVNIAPLIAGGTAAGIGNVRSKSFTSFSDFTLADLIVGNLPLPAQFEARLEGEEVALTWEVLAADDSEQFEIHRSTDGLNFALIHTEQATGQSGYITWDADLSEQEKDYFYRLRSIDANGNDLWSQTEWVRLSGVEQPGIRVFPNPNAGEFGVELAGFSTSRTVSVRVLNSLGQLVWKESFLPTQNRVILPIELLTASGIYFVEVFDGTHQMVKKIRVE